MYRVLSISVSMKGEIKKKKKKVKKRKRSEVDDPTPAIDAENDLLENENENSSDSDITKKSKKVKKKKKKKKKEKKEKKKKKEKNGSDSAGTTERTIDETQMENEVENEVSVDLSKTLSTEISSVSVELSCLEKCQIRMSVAMPPEYLSLDAGHKSGAHKFVRSILNKKILRWEDELQGIPLSYSSLVVNRHSNSNAILYNHSVFAFFEVQFGAVVFRPQLGSTLVGKVNKVSASHIGILALGVFNASIKRERLLSQYEFDNEREGWMRKSSIEDTNDDSNVQSEIIVGSKIVFKVQR